MIKQSGFNNFARSLVKPKSRMYSPMPGKYSLRCRSCWMRSRFTTSTVGKTSSMSYEMVTPSFSKSRGTNVLGPTRVTRAPSFVSAKMFERATRLNKMSPMIATFNPSIRFFFSRMV